jgi:hypothetical protein
MCWKWYNLKTAVILSFYNHEWHSSAMNKTVCTRILGIVIKTKCCSGAVSTPVLNFNGPRFDSWSGYQLSRQVYHFNLPFHEKYWTLPVPPTIVLPSCCITNAAEKLLLNSERYRVKYRQ